MPADAAEREPKVNAGRHALPLGDADGAETDVVGILEHAHRPTAVERDVELAGDAVELAMVHDVVMHRPRVRPRVEELLRIDAGGRAASDVADVIGPRALHDDAKILQRLDDADTVLRLDLA